MTIKMVKAEEKHIAAIGQLWWEFMLFHQNIDPIFTPCEDSILGFEENHLRRFIRSETGLALVALDRIKVIGFSLSEIRGSSPGFKREEYGYVDSMAVTASHCRKGVGEKMLNKIIKWFQSKGINRVELGTAAPNIVANSFWQKQGFTIYRHTLYKDI
jgi:GNAT superfamily N-acetyltransferase